MMLNVELSDMSDLMRSISEYEYLANTSPQRDMAIKIWSRGLNR